MTITERLTQWAIDKIRTDYPDDIALLVAVTGHAVDGDGHGECFDYFVPCTERGNELGQDFILGGVGHDLYPRDWARMERTANLDDGSTWCLGNAQILYSRTPEDRQRFETLRTKLLTNLKDRTFIYQKALQWLNVGMDQYRTLMFDDQIQRVRTAAGLVHWHMSYCVYTLNGTYYGQTGLRDGAIPHLQRLAELPDRFVELYRAVMDAEDIPALRDLAHEIIQVTRAFIAAHKPDGLKPDINTDFHQLAQWYEEMSLTCRRVRYYSRMGNADAAFVDACSMQKELDIVCDEFGLPQIDVMGSWDPHDLQKISDRATEMERQIIQIIEDHGEKVRSYATIEDFLQDN